MTAAAAPVALRQMPDCTATNRAAMPHLASVVDEFRRVFGADQVQVIFAQENGHTLGRPPDPGVVAYPPHVPVKRRRSKESRS